MKLTEAQRQQLLDDAVAAVKAWLADTTPRVSAGPHMHSQETRQAPETRRLHERAVEAVTAAVVKGDHIHTLITVRVGCPGMRVVDLIEDRDAYEAALVRERHVAERYAASVRDVIRGQALAMHGRGATKLEVAARLSVTRITLDDWLRKAEAGDTPSTAWDGVRPVSAS